jgi:hypothetical protein
VELTFCLHIGAAACFARTGQHGCGKRVQLEMGDEGGKVKLAEQVTFGGIDRLCDFLCLIRISPQLLHLTHEQLVVAMRAAIGEDVGRVVLQQAPEILGEDLHSVRVDKL